MQTIQIDSPQYQRLLDDLNNAPKKVLPFVSHAMELSVMAVKGNLAQYPPATDANRRGRVKIKNGKIIPLGYYERGKGWWSPIISRDRLKAEAKKRGGFGRSIARGIISYKGSKVVAGFKLHPTSQNLGKHWVTEVVTDNHGVLGSVGTNVTYADFVQGQNQAKIPASRDWTNIDQAVERADEKINAAFMEAAQKYIESIGV